MRVIETVNQTGVDPKKISLEITESSTMMDPEYAKTVLKEFKEFGFSVALDDFGTGYSSLSYLRQFPIDILKMDRSFIVEVDKRKDDATIVSAIVHMAHSLGLKVVAEGVETADQLDKLAQMGCDLVQGYYLSRPLEPDGLLDF